MTYEEAKNRVNTLLNKESYSQEEKIEIEELSKLILREEIEDCNCVNRWSDALIKMRKYMRDKTDFNNCKYDMQRGASFRKDGKLYLNTNLTDEAAEWFIANYPEQAHLIRKVVAEEVKVKKTRKVK